jgi:hypothetical protein
MASNLDYLNPDLQPLVEKVEAYLAAEKELQQLTIAGRNEATHDANVAASAATFEQRPPTGSFDQHADEMRSTACARTSSACCLPATSG